MTEESVVAHLFLKKRVALYGQYRIILQYRIFLLSRLPGNGRREKLTFSARKQTSGLTQEAIKIIVLKKEEKESFFLLTL
jgi:hypothetical protein